jgi:3',5'-cyclic AMP phosphodiesterase CpdA
MTTILTLAHISDLHLTPIAGFDAKYWNVKRVLGYLNWRRGRRHVHLQAVADALVADARAQGVDHFAVTGDLINIGLPAEIALARQWLARLGPEDGVSLVPGNHDIYTKRMHGVSCLKEWSAYMTSCSDGRRLMASEEDVFPYVRNLGRASLIGVNSALPRAPFVAAGRVGASQLRRLAHVLDRCGREGRIRVVMIHHPPLPGQAPRLRALDDAHELRAVIAENGAEIVLHGHNHQHSLAYVASHASGDVPVVGVASGSAARVHNGEPLAAYKLIRIRDGGEAGSIEIETRGLAEPGGGVHTLERHTVTPRIGVRRTVLT